jgi:HlyD family secretion protein
MNIIYKLSVLLIVFLSFSCSNRNGKADAYGSFEAEEIIVSAEGNGKILELKLEEGQILKENQYIGLIDTAQLYLQKQQLNAQLEGTLAQRTDIPKQLKALQEKLSGMMNEKKRLQSLLQSNAATNKQMDDLNTEIQVVKSQLDATRSNLNVQNKGVLSQIDAMQYQITSLENAIQKCLIHSPIHGTVLKKYINQYEFISTGRPIFKIADVSKMTLKVYITEDQLSSLKLGGSCSVRVDKKDKELKEYKGKITWISNESEFTPKMIQTKNERVNLVYAVKISVKNDGDIKIGMPGDVVFE